MTVAAVSAIILTVDISQVIRALERVPPVVLGLVVALLAADRVLMGFKWRHLVNGAGGHMRIRDAVAIYFQSGFAALLLPTSVGGEVLRGVLGQRAGVPLQLLLASMVTEKLVAGLSNAALAVAGALYIVSVADDHHATVGLLVAGSTLIVAGAVVLAGNRRAHQRIGRLLRRWVPQRGFRLMDQSSASVVDYWRRKTLLRTNLLLNIVEHLLQFAALYLLARGLGIDFGLLPFLAVTAVVMLVRRTVGFLESWWLAESAVVVLYTLFGVPEALSVALAFTLWAASIVATLPGAVQLYRMGLTVGEWRPSSAVRAAGERGRSRTF
ncbi:MAG TPA: lysylphosphatidylglycerol synthase transmembrane domain-containing protein [Gemmatimonadales bacterium]|nr:lysylphosphatidylglycerol synthase transmembrane domain-containing protein [Gemmatimonadales bacterium]